MIFGKTLKILSITNICSHYRRPVYEILAKNHNVKFVFYSDGGEYYFDKKNGLMFGTLDGEYLWGFYLLPNVRITPKLLWYLLFTRYDCILLGLVGRFSILSTFLIGKYIRRKPIIGWLGMWTHPQTLFHRITFTLTRALYKRLDSILVYGTHSQRYLVNMGVQPQKIFCAWNAVDNSVFDHQVLPSEIQKFRDELGIGDRKIVLYVGRLTPIKGLSYLIESVSHVNKTISNYVLLIVGDGELEDELKTQVKRLQLPNVYFHHYVRNNELSILYAAAYTIVLPSITYHGNRETWGLVCNEAMIQGCPVIASDAVGAAVGGLVVHSENGLVVPERNVYELTKAISTMLSDDHLRERMSINCMVKMKTWNPEYQYSGVDKALHHVLP